MPLIEEAWERRTDDPTLEPTTYRRQLQLAAAMGAIPADYFQYYYFTDEVLAELAGQADDARRGHPRLGARLLAPLRGAGDERRPAARSRPLARRHPRARARDRRDGRRLQRQGRGAPRQRAERRRRASRLPGGPRRRGAGPLPRTAGSRRCPRPRRCPATCAGSIEMLGEYQALAAEAAWSGTRHDGVRALGANPLVRAARARPSGSTTSSPPRTATHLPERLLRPEASASAPPRRRRRQHEDDRLLAPSATARSSAPVRGGAPTSTTPSRAARPLVEIDARVPGRARGGGRSAGGCRGRPPSAWPAQTGPRTSTCSARSCRGVGPRRASPVVVNDAVGALRAAATDDGVGVAAVCGTYCAVAARGDERRGLPLRLLARRDRARTLSAPRRSRRSGVACSAGACDVAHRPGPRALGLCRTRSSCCTRSHRRGGRSTPERALFADAVLDEAEAGDAVARRDRRASRRTRLGDYAACLRGETNRPARAVPARL